MKVTVNYFGQVRQIAGKESEAGDYRESLGLCELVADLAEKYGSEFRGIVLDASGQLRPSLLALINGQAVDKGARAELKDGDEVTLLPPIAGG